MSRCFSCEYFWFFGLRWHCFHPANNKAIKRPVGCSKYQDSHKKIMPVNGEYEYGYVERLPIE